MLLAMLVIIVLVFGTHYVLARLTTRPIASGVAATVALSFVFGLLSSRAFFGSAPVTVAPAATAAPVAAGPPPTIGPHVTQGRNVSARCSRANAVQGTASAGWVDLITPNAGKTHIPDGGTLDRRDVYWLNGWAAEPSMLRHAEGVCLVVDGHVEPRAVVYYGIPRPDVAAQWSALDHAGFDIEITPHLLRPGPHRLQAVAGVADGRYYMLSGRRDITAR